MKRIISIIISISFLMMSVPAFAISGTGTESNPYLISSASDIAKIRNDLDGYYKLTSNINMSGVDFEPIGNENEGAFTGTIDGNGYAISNLNINLPENKYVGFVGYLEGTIINLKLTDVNAYGYRYVGGIVGYGEKDSKIVNCNATGTVSGKYNIIDLNVGGVIGVSTGSVVECSSSINICTDINYQNYASVHAGGIAGCNYSEGIIKKSNNSGVISTINCGGYNSHIYLSGISGYNNGEIDNCTNEGQVSYSDFSSSNYIYIGGISGGNYNKINDSYNYGIFLDNSGSSRQELGGICGYNNGIVKDSLNYSNIKHNAYSMGGITGNNAGNVINCSNYGIINSTSEYNSYSVGGIVGKNNSEIKNCRNNTTVISNNADVGGVVGTNLYLIDACINNGCIETSYGYIGGIAGNNGNSSSKIVSSINNASVTSSSTFSGGICSINYGNVMDCQNYGSVTSTTAGGIVAFNCYTNSNIKTYVTECLNSGSVNGTGKAGGVVGYNGEYGYITNCKNIGDITSPNIGDLSATKQGFIQSITLSSGSVPIGQTTFLPITLYGYSGALKYVSDNMAIATISSNGEITGCSIGTTEITVCTNIGVTSTATITVTQPSTNIALNKTNVVTYVDSTYQLSATILPSSTTDTIVWSSSNENYVAVSDNGLITGVSEGTATITATASSGLTATCYVTVKAAQVMPTSVTLSDTYITLAPEDAKALIPTFEPFNTTETTLVWTSSDESVATVDKNGVVTAVSNGFATIRGKTTNGLTSECVVKVVSATGTSVLLDNTKASPGGTAQVKANIVKNPGLSAYKFKVNCDADVLTPVSITPNAEFGGTFSTNLEDANRTELNVLWYSGNEDVVVNGELFTVNFKVNDSAAYGDSSIVSIEYGATDVCDVSGNYIAIYTENATVSITDPRPGDIYEDSDVNVYDLTLLARYITSLETFTERQEEAADVNNDGRVDILDVIRLAQYLVKWSGIELMSLGLYDEPTTPAISVGSASVNESNEAEIPVYIKNNSGILGYRFVLDYNAEDIEILSITPSELINNDGFNHNLGAESQATDGLVVSCFTSGNNITDDGVLFTIKVRYKNPTDTFVSPISIVDNFNNMGNENATYVTATYETGYALGRDYIVANKVVGDTNFSCELYFDNSYAEQSAKAIIAFYDGNGRMVQLMPKDITVKPGKVDLSIDYDKKAYATYKLMIWEGVGNLKPITDVK